MAVSHTLRGNRKRSPTARAVEKWRNVREHRPHRDPSDFSGRPHARSGRHERETVPSRPQLLTPPAVMPR